MNNAKYIVTWICLLWLTIGSCVDKFNAHLPESSTRVLIVEGNIISDSTVVFSLSCSFPLNVEGIPQDYNKIDAEVSVVGSDGSCFNGTSLGDGKYQVVIGSLNKDASYSLKIVYEGDIYTSEPQYPLETETINDVTYEQPEKYGDISIRFSMRSEDGGCYFWSYEEDWEVRAVYNPKFRYDPTTDEVVDFDATSYARGWCHDKSAKIIVGNIGTNKDTQLKDMSEIRNADSGQHFSILHRMLLAFCGILQTRADYPELAKEVCHIRLLIRLLAFRFAHMRVL